MKETVSHIHKEDSMNMRLHNQVNVTDEKATRMLHFYTQGVATKFQREQWETVVWLDEVSTSSKRNSLVCGIKLQRPRKSPIYIKKKGATLRMAIAKAVKALGNHLRRIKGKETYNYV
jgi:hypothetical protein